MLLYPKYSHFLLCFPSLGDNHFCPQLTANLLYLLPVFLPLLLPCIPLAPVLALSVFLCTVFPFLPLFLFGCAVAVFDSRLVWLAVLLVVLLGVLEPLALPALLPAGCLVLWASPGLLPLLSALGPLSACPPALSTRAALLHLALCPWVVSYFALLLVSSDSSPSCQCSVGQPARSQRAILPCVLG